MVNPQFQKRARVTQLYVNDAKTALILFNEKAERAVLGAVLQKPELFPSLSHLLQAADFWKLTHGFLWYILDKMTANGEQIDLLTIADAFEREEKNPFKNATDNLLRELSSLYGAASDADHAEAYALQVREAALKLRVIQQLDGLKAKILSGALHGEELKDEVTRRIFEATEQSTLRHTDARSMMVNFIDGFSEGVNPAIPTGFSHLDNLLNGHGLFPGEITVWAGAEGMGKTTALLSLLRNVVKAGYCVALFSMEMEQKEVSQALVTMETGIPRASIQSRRLSAQQLEAAVTVAGQIGNWRYHVIDMHEFPALKPMQLKRKLRSLMLTTPIDLVILDGLWLMQPDEPNPNRFEAVGAITRDLSGIAKSFELPIVVAHQYKEEIRRAKNPTVYHLAESAGVRRNAQVIIGMWRASYFNEGASDQTTLYVMKNRNRGKTGESALLPYNVKFNRFGDEYGE